MAEMSQKDKDALSAAGKAWTEANARGDKAGMDAAHKQAESIRNNYGYSGGSDGSQKIPTSSSGGNKEIRDTSGGSSSSGVKKTVTAQESGYQAKGDWSGDKSLPEDVQAELRKYGEAYNNATSDEERQAAHDGAEAIRAKYGYSGGTDGSENIRKPQQPELNFTGTVPDFTGLLNSWMDASRLQQENKIDYTVSQGIKELERAKEDAETQFQTQQNQTDIDEAKALDNQALYAEARGDRGGIGQAQYSQIQAQAMENRRQINSARTKLATDTARQIADLRAQGEFQKADALLQLTQNYLSQLIELQKWGAEYSLNVAQFQAQLDQWQQEFELSVGDLMGVYKGQQTLAARKQEQQWLAESGMAALAVGVKPSAEQQAAMGYTDAQIEGALAQYKLEQQMKLASSKSSGGSRSSSSSGDGTLESENQDIYTELFNAGIRDADRAYAYLIQKKYASGAAEKIADAYEAGIYDELKRASLRDEAGIEDVNRKQALYQSLGKEAKQIVSNIQRGNSRSGNAGLSQAWADRLDNYLKQGKITDKELDTILTLLGY